MRTSECFEKLFEGVINENDEANNMLEVNFDEEDDSDDNQEDADGENEEENEEDDEQVALRIQLEELNAR